MGNARSGGDVRHQLRAQPLNFVFQDELFLFHAAQHQLVAETRGQKMRKHYVEIPVAGFQGGYTHPQGGFFKRLHERGKERASP